MNFKPTMYAKDIYHVDFNKVYNMGYRILLIDLDNTLVPHDVSDPTKESIELVDNLKSIGFEVVILSNNTQKRVATFANPLDVEYIYSTRKPMKYKYNRLINKMNYDRDKIVCIGDQIMTDVYGANRLGLANMLVEPLAPKDILWTKFNRFLERRVFKKLEKQGRLIKGEYYYE